MIDYFNISFAVHAELPIGDRRTTERVGGHSTISRTPVKLKFGRHSPTFEVRQDIHRCPLVWLQGHNAMGSNDFRGLVDVVVRLALQALGVEFSADLRDAVESGNYRVHEVHVAEHHRMPRKLIRTLCREIHRYAPTSLLAERLPQKKAVGVRLWPNSRSRSVLLYDKRNYYDDNPPKHRARLFGSLTNGDAYRQALASSFEKALAHLEQGVRIETRFRSALTALKLTRGMDWDISTARRIHLATLQRVPLSAVPELADLPELVDQIENHKLHLCVRLWSLGEDVQASFGTRKTFERTRKVALERYGIDFRRPPLTWGGSWQTLIERESIISVPRWAKDRQFVFSPCWKSQPETDSTTHFEKVWLRNRGTPNGTAGGTQTERQKAARAEVLGPY